MVAILRGVPLTLQEAKVHPADRNLQLGVHNPLAKIPVLLAPEGALFDSRVICRYLDAKGEGPGLYDGPDPWSSLRVEALADGLMDAAVVLRYELVSRPADLVWQGWASAQRQRIEAVLDHLERGSEALSPLDIGTVGLAAALAYLDFRHAATDWWSSRPHLRCWLDMQTNTAAMKLTPYPPV